jgi:tRNA(adenine34) deaminase
MFFPEDADGQPKPNLKEHFMREALRQAQRAIEKDEVPIGVVIIHKNRIIAKAFNQTLLLKDPTAHAEMIAITQAAEHLQHSSGRLLETELYVTVEPCPMCMGAIIQARIPKVFYGAANEKYGACGSVVDLLKAGRWNHTVQVEKGVLAAEAAALMQGFFRSKRAKLAE